MLKSLRLGLSMVLCCVACSDGSQAGQDAGPLAGNAAGAGAGSTAGNSGMLLPDGAIDVPDGGLGTEDAGPLASSPTENTEACLAYVRGWCTGRIACGLWGTSDVDDCVQEAGLSCPDLLLSDGSTRTPETLRSCGVEWSTATCEDIETRQVPACATVGTRKAGEACIFASQCESVTCTANGNMCGTCLATVKIGTACDGSVPCEPAGDCVSSMCVRRTLHAALPLPPPPPLALGDTCNPGDPQCGNNNCAAASDGTYHCVSYPKLGEDCSGPRTCELGGDSYCDVSLKCVALPSTGQPCGVDGFTGVPSWCDNNSFCNMSGTPVLCVARGGVGEDCETTVCASDLSCRCIDVMCSQRTCQRARKLGESCTAPGDSCQPGVQTCEAGVCKYVVTQNLFQKLCMP